MTKIEKILFMHKSGTPAGMIQAAIGCSAGDVSRALLKDATEKKPTAAVGKAFTKFQSQMLAMRKSLNKSGFSAQDFIGKWVIQLVKDGFSDGMVLNCFPPADHEVVKSFMRRAGRQV